MAFTFAHGCWEWPTWRVMRDVVKPATERAGRCRYTELPAVAPFMGLASMFVSHCRGAPWGDLFLAAARGSRGDRYLWCGIFAVWLASDEADSAKKKLAFFPALVRHGARGRGALQRRGRGRGGPRREGAAGGHE